MPKIVDHDARRAEIAAAAADAIDDEGLDRVRLVDVARRASCTTGAVSHYFPGKDAVLGAALEHVLRNLTSNVPSEALRCCAGDPVEIAAALAEVLPLDAARRRDWRVWIAFCGRAVSTPELAELHRASYAEIQRELAGELAEIGLAEQGAEAQQLAVALVAAIDGLGFRATLEPDEWPASRLRALLEYQVVPMLRAERGVGLEFTRDFQPDEKSA